MYEWKDPDFTLGGSSNTAYWFVKAYNGSYSSATNTVSTNVLYYDKSKTEQVYTIEKTSTFELITQ